MNVNKLRKKQKRYSFLQTLCYLLGFPLLLALVFFGSTAMIYGGNFPDTWFYGLAAVVALWLVVTLLQLVVCIFSKNKNARCLWSMIFTMIFVIGGAVAFDYYGEKTVTDTQKAYEAYKGVTIKDYKYQINYYEPFTPGKASLVDSYNKSVEDFCRVYNIGLKGKVFNDSKNADGSPVTFDEETGAYYSPNGMYADGYIVSMNQAIDILININEVRAKYEALEKDADKELAAALAKAEASSAWSSYKNTAEYKAAYGENGTAYEHMLTMDQVDEILSILGANLDKLLDNDMVGIVINALLTDATLKSTITDLVNKDLSLQKVCDTVNDLKVGTILGLVEGKIEDIDAELLDVVYEAILPVLDYATGTTVTQESLKNMTVKQLLNALDFEKVNKVATGFGFALDDYESVFVNGLTPALVENLVKSLSITSNLFFYQSPTTKPLMSFIEDEEMKTYAYNMYYATTHGANVGSVLIGDSIGAVTFSTKGYPSATFGYTLTQLYQLRADNSYIPTLYPLFAARRYMYVCGGLIAIMFALYYHNSKKKAAVFEQIAQGGIA